MCAIWINGDKRGKGAVPGNIEKMGDFDMGQTRKPIPERGFAVKGRPWNFFRLVMSYAHSIDLEVPKDFVGLVFVFPRSGVGNQVVTVCCARLSSRSFRMRLHPISIPS